MFSRAEGKPASNVVPLAKLKGAAGRSRTQSNGSKVYQDLFLNDILLAEKKKKALIPLKFWKYIF